MAIAVHRHKVHRKDPQHNYTVALCDGCGADHLACKVPGRGSKADTDLAHALALENGRAERMESIRKTRPRSRKMVWYVKLLCPACQAKEAT